MKKIIVMFFVLAILQVSCNRAHKSQSWHPKAGKKMKTGHNNK